MEELKKLFLNYHLTPIVYKDLDKFIYDFQQYKEHQNNVLLRVNFKESFYVLHCSLKADKAAHFITDRDLEFLTNKIKEGVNYELQ